MARDTSINFGPAGACDACGRFCCSLDQAGSPESPGIPCYHCGQGQFRHRSLWTFLACPACSGARCEHCHLTGVVAVPREGVC